MTTPLPHQNEAFQPTHDIPDQVAQHAIELLMDWQTQAAPDTWDRILDWRREHPDHERAWQQIEVTYKHFAELSPASTELARQTLNSSQQTRRRTVKMLTLLCVGVGGGLLLSQQPDHTIQQAYHQTDTGEQLTLELTNGSLVQLNSRTIIQLERNLEDIQIRLLQGEIFIRTVVALDSSAPRLPLFVTTQQGLLTPVGTEFNVRQLATTTEVSVLAGQVLLLSGPITQPHVIPTGHVITFSKDQLLEQRPIHPSDAAWTHGMLIAEGMPLRQFINELSVHHLGVIRIDPALDTLRVSGSYPIHDTQNVLESLSYSLPIQLKHVSRYWISLHPSKELKK